MRNEICESCTGCGACFAICPKQCINMQENAIGELVPEIDKSVCIKCGLCKKTCPQLNQCTSVYPKLCYVAWSKNENDYIFSASGGVAASFCRQQLDNNAFFYGCDYDYDNLSLNHFLCKNVNDVKRIQSSKYSQSTSFFIYKEIKAMANKYPDKDIVFVGTPCQVAGLKKYIGLKSNVICVDLVCHGTPPNKYLVEHISSLNLKGEIKKVRFRGEFDQKLTVYGIEDILYQKDKDDDTYFKAFYSNMISRNSCYECKYAKAERISDITIADFWGLGELKEITKKSSRPSLVLINTKEGERYFELVKDQLIYEERKVIEAIKGNGRLNRPPGKSIYAVWFQRFYRVFHFEKSLIYANKTAKLNLQIKNYKSIIYYKILNVRNRIRRRKNDT